MKSKYLDSAIQQIPGPELLINLVSRRVRQLTQGHRPMTQTDPKMDYTDIALKEITEGKIGYELPTGPEVLPHSNVQEI
jgi:DNA-directed RNA polymerase subunit omega